MTNTSRVSRYLVALFCCVPLLLYAKEIHVSIQLQPNQRDKFEQVLRQFYVETGIKAKSIVETDLAYKEKVPIWLIEGKDTPDVMFWSASQRLYRYVDKGLILPLTDLWEEQNYDEQFSHVKQGVTRNGEVYAMPFAYYHWGIFYRKSMLEQFGGVPTNWETFLTILSRMKASGITPIGIGTKQNWPAAAWFDYINLRTNGLDFHLNLLSGKTSFYDERVQNVLTLWKQLVDNQFYNQDNPSHEWDGVLPLFYRNQIGFLLLGNFVASKWPSTLHVIEDIEFMPFPTIDANMPFYEDAPTDIFMIPKNTTKPEEAKAFIRFIARADVQSFLNESLGYLPPNTDSNAGQDRFIKAGERLLARADGLAQFFDRDTLPDFDKLATPLLADFIQTGNVEELTEKLEQARLTIFGPIQNQ